MCVRAWAQAPSIERGQQREREKEGGRQRERERERERCRICLELLVLFLKGMTGALAPFSYLVSDICSQKTFPTPLKVLALPHAFN